MKSMADWWNRRAVERQGYLSEHQWALREKFFELLDLWNDGDIGLTDVTAMGGGAYVISMLYQTIEHSDPHWEMAGRYLDAEINRSRDGIYTKHGFFSREEIESIGGKLTEYADPDTGEIDLVAIFPTGYATGIDGKANYDMPIYGSRPVREDIEKLFERPPISGEESWWGAKLDTDQRQSAE